MLLFWLGSLLFLPGQAHAESSLEQLVRRADEVARGKTSAAIMTMEVKTKNYHRSYEIVAWDDSQGGDKTLIKILGPVAYRGFGTLKLGEQLKLYDPKTNHVQVVGPSMLGGSWMGSHFTNDDLVKETRLSRDYNLKLVKKWHGTEVGRDATHYRVQMTPKPSAPVAWGRIDYELWEAGDAIVPMSAGYFRKAGDKAAARTLTFSGVKVMDGRTLPTVLVMRVASKPGEFTKITYNKLRLNVAIPENQFTEQALRRR